MDGGAWWAATSLLNQIKLLLIHRAFGSGVLLSSFYLTFLFILLRPQVQYGNLLHLV